jgi:hypothetical protein
MRFSPPQQLFGFVALIRFPANATETTSVWRGVYTNEQAALGKARYFAARAACHGGLLQVTSESAQIAGTAFVKRRGDQPVAALFALASDSNADRTARPARFNPGPACATR